MLKNTAQISVGGSQSKFEKIFIIYRLLHNASDTYAYFFWILSPVKMKFGQILVCCMTNISNMFLGECWLLETSSRLFYDFIKMAIQQDLAISNGWHIPVLIVLSLFTFSKKWKTGILAYLIIE